MAFSGLILEPTQQVFVVAVLIGIFAAVSATPQIDCTPINPNDPTDYLRPDPWDCTKFFKCDNGNPKRFDCPSGLYFSTTLKVCDWPRNVDCGYRPIPGQKNSDQPPWNNGGQGWYDQNNGGQQTHNPNQGHSNNVPEYNNEHWQSAGVQYQNGENVDGTYYPVQMFNDYSGGPSITEPISEGAENRPRPTIDDLYSENNAHNDYLISSNDIRK